MHFPRPDCRLLCTLLALTAASAVCADPCPALGKVYDLFETTPAANDVLNVLQARKSRPSPTRLQLVWADGHERLELRTGKHVPGRQPVLESRRHLIAGRDFDCESGWVVLRAALPATRGNGSDGRMTGTSSVRLRSQYLESATLEIEVTFKGRRRISLFGYDSASLDVPVPFSGRTLRDTMQLPWAGPVGTDPEPQAGR
jgi:hypothetical protein